MQKITIYNFRLYFKYIFFDLICVFIHEFSHWIVTMFTLIFTGGMHGFPIPRITTKPTFFIHKDGSYSITGWAAHVETSYSSSYKGLYMKFILMLSTVAPAITVVGMLIYLPWYAKIYVLMNMDMLWLSGSDTMSIVHTCKLFKRVFTRNCKSYCKTVEPKLELDLETVC